MDMHKFLKYELNSNDKDYVPSYNMEAFGDFLRISVEKVHIKDSVLLLLDGNGSVAFIWDMDESVPVIGFEGCSFTFEGRQWNEKRKGISMSALVVESLTVDLRKIRIDGLGEEMTLILVSSDSSDDTDSKLVDMADVFVKNCGAFLKHKDRESDLLLKALDSMNDGITLCDSKGYLRYVNDGATKILNISKEQIQGKEVDSFSREEPMLIKILKSRKNIIDEEYFLKFGDKTVHLINSGYPIFDDEGKLLGAIDNFRSIERSKMLANTLAGHHAFFTFDNMIGKSGRITEVVNLAKRYALSSESILIIGDSGTGKELMAQSIHNYSNRKDKPFIALNCANFPDELIDSELFGYEEGAFTGAKKGGKPGKFEMAEGGTLFLDEIGEMPIHLQAKLLRVLETRSIYRLGGNKPISVDVRILAATNRDLKEQVEEKKFRGDLYYRLNVLFLEIPSLNDRGEDILLLAEHFIESFAHSTGKRIKGVTEDARKMLMNHHWKGNVRELENIMSRAMFISESDIIDRRTLLKAGLMERNEDGEILINRIILTRDHVVKTLEENGGNKKRTAEILGISRPTLYRILKETID